SVKQAYQHLKDTFIVISGDALTDIDLSAAAESHRKNGAVATLVLKREPMPPEYGVVITDEAGKVKRFLEKPAWGEVFSDTVNTGIYVLEPEVLSGFSADETKDFSKEVFPSLLKKGAPVYGYIADGYWCDIGGLKPYMQSHMDVLDGKCRLPDIKAKEVLKGIWIGQDASVDDGALLQAPCFIGEGAYIAEGAKIGEYSVIGSGAKVGRGCSLKRSILWEGAVLYDDVEIRGTVVGGRAVMESRSRAFEGSVIGDGTSVGEDACINPGVQLWPGKQVAAKKTVCTNIVWGAGDEMPLFNGGRVSGRAGRQLCPENAALLGRAMGEIYPKNADVALCDDGTPAAVMIRHALISGLCAQGVRCFDAGSQPFHVLSDAVKNYSMSGGACAYTCGEICSVLFLDERGVPVHKGPEKKAIALMERRSMACEPGGNIKSPLKLEGLALQSIAALLEQTDMRTVSSSKLKIAVSRDGNSHFIAECLEAAGVKTEQMDIPEPYPQKLPDMKGCALAVSQTGYFGDDNLVLYDEEGNRIRPFGIFGLKLLMLIRRSGIKKAVLPANCPDAFAIMCEEAGARPVYSRVSIREMMDSVISTYGEGGVQEYARQLYFSEPFFILQLVEFMEKRKALLSELVGEVPDFHMVKKSVPCQLCDFGTVMRKLSLQGADEGMPEGTRIKAGGGWAMVLPDADAQCMHIFGHGYSEEYAEDISNIACEQVGKLLRRD
ncbi:MAG: sugar phosphate nucleotidyltransferase, partial [Bacillota bacterium]|nr:sugar phosphate nucleotidyltransferase [Bacillota bacterium]